MTEADRTYVRLLSQLFPELSEAEQDSVVLFCMGKSPADIARDRGVEKSSVDTHFKRARRKLNCESIHDLRIIFNIRVTAQGVLQRTGAVFFNSVM
ncbi:sigma factor-like helix-turn-helix DNA-binding protein [Morganella morganii]|uniref:helix-turn-helix transcriptional regulator n=1 Tax=Morganella morganii TaxID=582 RepID=UPI00046ACB0B